MKHFFNDPRTTVFSEVWTVGRPLVKAGGFFNSGEVMHMSRKCPLRTLLHAVLKNDKQHLIQVFEERWQQFVSFGGGREPFTWAELRRAFENIVSTPSSGKTVLFLIDGLDDLNGKKQELVDLVLQDGRYVKVYVASRP